MKAFIMNDPETVIATFPDHHAAEAAVKALTEGGVAMNSLTIVGKGYHTEEKVVGFYNAGDRIKFWGSRGAYWGGLWGLFVGGVFLTLPVAGPVFVLGFLSAAIISAIEGAVVVGGIGALGAALSGIGVPENSVIEYRTAIEADSFLVMAHGTAAQVEKARTLLAGRSPAGLDVHSAGRDAPAPRLQPAA